MYTTQKNVQVLISLLKQYDIRHIVISPGSRNMAFVRSVETDSFFTTYSVVDERSAAYFAIGVWLETGRPVALSSTSAQATRNYIPGMTEAYYRGAQLVFITGDYRPSMIGQNVMQAIDQLSIPKDSAKLSVCLPHVSDTKDYRHCMRLVNEALLELNHHGAGPVHIDVPTEEHWAGGVAELPVAAKISRHTSVDTYPEIGDRKVLVAVGQHHVFTKKQQKALDEFSQRYNAVVYVNHLSNYRGPRSLEANLLLEGMDHKKFKDFAPDIVITIGGQPGDYALNGFLGAPPMYAHWRVHEDGELRDTYSKLTDVFETTEEVFFETYNQKAKKLKSSDNYFDLWSRLVNNRIIPDNLPLSHAYIASQMINRLPSHSVVHFGILSSLRNWSYFRNDVELIGYSNVAAFGIDGCLSTFIGQTVASDRLNFLIIGDLSFFYDMNVLGNRHVKSNARVVLINNGGGGEFRLYSHSANSFGDSANKHIAAAGHHGSAQAWAESMNWRYIQIKTKEGLATSLDQIMGESDRPIITEIFTTMSDDSDGVKKMTAANASKSLQSKAASALSPSAKRTIKKILKR